MNAQRAINFVNTHGSSIEKARLRFALNGEPASPDDLITLFADQREDGGFAPLWASDYSSLDATCFHIAQAAQLGVSAAQPNLARALSFLKQRQNKSGSWEEDARVTDAAPAWARPGDKAAMLYLTATCGFWMAVMKTSAAAADLASGFLKLRMSDRSEMPGFVQTYWLAGAVWTIQGEREFVARSLKQLAERIEKMTASELVWMIITFGLAGLQGNHALMYAAASRLDKLQDPLGPWHGDENNDVHVTVEALQALKLCKRI